MEPKARKAYPSDVSDDVWAFVVPYLTLLPLDAGQRKYELREVFNALTGWQGRSHSGTTFPMTFPLAISLANKPNAE
ncbi:hypothetical protein MGR01S_06730 [Meiothermus granaticius NBRC 107808]|nr:hypothetical protein MGR01S_06730 [Meiothermus granaticius NBRC 107808]